MTLVEELAKYLDMDEATIRANLLKLTLSELVEVIDNVKKDNKEEVFKAVSGSSI